MLTEAELNAYLGRPKTFHPVQVQSRLPWTPRLSNGRVQVVLAHPAIADLFVNACHAAAAVSDWVPKRIDSYSPRAIRGYNLPAGWELGDKGTSRHSWAAAWDFFATPADVPPPGGVWTPDNPVPGEFGAVFEAAGFVWGRHWRRRDDPHIELGIAPPAGPNLDPDFLSELLKQGDVGDEVRALQFSLRALGHDVDPTGIFDSVTHGVVIAVQTAGRTTVDGIVGPKTEAVIVSMIVQTYGGKIPELVTAAYVDAVGHEPDAEGLRHYAERVDSRALHVPELWAELWDSEEGIRFRALADLVPLRERIRDLETSLEAAENESRYQRIRIEQIRSTGIDLLESAQAIVEAATE